MKRIICSIVSFFRNIFKKNTKKEEVELVATPYVRIRVIDPNRIKKLN